MLNEVKDVYDTSSPEFKLLIACLRQQISQKELDTTLFTMPIDWEHFIYLAVYHRVYPLIYQYVSTCEYAALPREVISRLRQKCLENTAKTLQMVGDIVKVLRTLEENGIQAVVLKGFPLATQLYGNVGARPSRDVDIFVWPKDVDKARNIIETHGYNREYPSFKTIPKWPQKWMQRNHHFVYWHGKKNVCIELHWKMGRPGMEIPLDNIESSLMQVNIAGQQIYTLKTEELFLFLILHGASHGWFRLKWLCDIGTMLQQVDFSWERLYTLTKHLDVEPILNQAIIFSRDVLGVTVPEYIAEVVTKDRKARKLANMSIPYITAADSGRTDLTIYMPSLYQQKRYEFFLQCGWKKKAVYILSHCLPTDRDIQIIPLPDCMYFMYYLIRPCTWLTSRLSTLIDK